MVAVWSEMEWLAAKGGRILVDDECIDKKRQCVCMLCIYIYYTYKCVCYIQ